MTGRISDVRARSHSAAPGARHDNELRPFGAQRRDGQILARAKGTRAQVDASHWSWRGDDERLHARFLPQPLRIRPTAATGDARSEVSETDRPAHHSRGYCWGYADVCRLSSPLTMDPAPSTEPLRSQTSEFPRFATPASTMSPPAYRTMPPPACGFVRAP